MKQIMFSPSALNLFLECPRCFWLDKNKEIKRPRGIFPSLPQGMDLVIKEYFDSYRKIDKLPPEIANKVKGRLFTDMELLTKWRNWRATNLVYTDTVQNVILSGALDDCLRDGDYLIPLDYKTRGSEIKEDSKNYYQTQLDCYCLMLEASGYKTKGFAYLIYYWPKEVKENGIVHFHVEAIKIKTNIESARLIVRDAAKLLYSEIPDPNPECEYCNLVEQRKRQEI